MTRSAKYTRFDAADYLENLDDVVAFLEVALEDSIDDPSAVPQRSASSPAPRTWASSLVASA